MMPETNYDEPVKQDEPAKHDEDVTFELEQEHAVIQPSLVKGKDKEVGETIIPVKEDTLGNSDFPPLSDTDKEPKLNDPS
jgi:hypothetical protein